MTETGLAVEQEGQGFAFLREDAAPQNVCGFRWALLCPRRVTVYLYVHIRIYVYAHST